MGRTTPANKRYKKIQKIGRGRPSTLMIVIVVVMALAALTLAGIALTM
ncbi:hypothetical protein [Marisediminicola senii]|nr:hypothetical protein [Marisediminicola senii]